ncbi:hypothetical protein GW835_02165 [archaeon]|nr:hypothetical protein [archaeon]NCP79351.1 hypothetical protein [archaeon]NCP97294.1 hypothetical protein [archaeon]NCQ07118.1 hypothetical protein [archaeon]NCQ50914.1 hypothetical protein [archaeon]
MITDELLTGTLFGLGFGSLLVFMFYFAIIILLAVFLYKAFALYTIAKKLNSKYAFLAWIPIGQYFLYPILAEERWEWGFIALLPIVAPLLFLPFTLIPFINMFLSLLILIGTLILVSFRTYWIWKIFEKRNYHGALSLLTLVSLANLIVLGIVAWVDKPSKKEKVSAKKEKPMTKKKTTTKPKTKKVVSKKKKTTKKIKK